MDGSLRQAIREFLEHLQFNRNASEHTVRAYESDLEQFVTAVASAQGRPRPSLVPGDFSPDSVRLYLGVLFRQGVSRASAGRKLAAVRTFGRWLRREGLLDSDPAALAASPKRDQKIPAHLSVDEMNRLLETPDRSMPLGRRDQAILELFYASGLRLSELVGLDLDDLNLSSRVVRVLGKGRKERLVPLNQSAAEAIRAYLKDREMILRGRLIGATGRARTSSVDARSEDAGDALAAEAIASRASAVPQLSRRAARRPQRASAGEEIRGDLQRALRHLSSRAAAFVRHPPARTRRRPARDSGDARPRAPQHDATLYPRQRRAVDRRLPAGASAREVAKRLGS